jgi:hypothetical protein
VHPLEHLRYVARSGWYDQRALVGEAADALRSLVDDPVGLVTSTRRLLEQQPTCAPLYWLCARLLLAPDPVRELREAMRTFDADPTAAHLVSTLPSDGSVLVVGHPVLVGEALADRPDLAVLMLDDASGSSRYMRRLGVDLELIDPAEVGYAVDRSSVVLVEPDACSPSDLLAARGARPAVSVAYCSAVPVWLVAGVGRRVADSVLDAMADRGVGLERIPTALVAAVVDESGMVDPVVVTPSCPPAPELMRRS